jgi:hypothetical protein
MTTTEITIGVLSTEDIAALRMARAVTFHHYQGRAFIRAHVAPSGHPATFTRRAQILFPEESSIPRERCREIQVSGSIAGYTDSGGGWRVDGDDTRATAFYMIHAAQHVPAWVTIAALLSPGEAVSLGWLADNNTENLQNAGFHCDELQLTTTKGKRKRVFAIATQVGPDNSARMIRRYGN